MKEYKVENNLTEKQINDLAKEGWILKFVNPLKFNKENHQLITQSVEARSSYNNILMQYIFERDGK